ncbi:radical SAM protein [Actinomadura darangshiensis]|uniref:Radical SAM protein n=1 Tax=Actinomadura darangshiensis TaxID=705336 RepID=A0A4R5AKT0_9ACTN|nr:radical SAM protein [Actinomadura darangshiensis]TDD73518.1 radical SAM protein [Actinomadura darangshiensis]
MFPADLVFPTSVCLRVTRRCNAACSFCQAPNTSRVMLTVAEIERIVAALRERGVATVKLSGGEPTSRADLAQIVMECGNQSVKPVVITNGISMHASVLSALKKVGGELKFSVHRPDSSNDLVLRVPSYQRVLAGIAASRSRSIPFSVNTVIAPGSTDLLPRMIGFAVEQGARKVSFIPVVPRGRAQARPEFEFDDAGLDSVRSAIGELSARYEPYIDVRCIDIRKRDYWIVENDGSLWLEKARDDDDVLICEKSALMAL